MRLLSFVPCGCRAGPIDDAPPAAAAAADHAGGDDAARRRRRRRNLRALAAGHRQWRPSLGDICEEYSTTDAAAKARRGRVAPVRGAGSSAWDVARVLPRAHSNNDYRYIICSTISISLQSVSISECGWCVILANKLAVLRCHVRHLESASSMRTLAPTAFLF
jgi:hypothetical protein